MTLIAIGGAENKTGDMSVLKRVLDEARGQKSRVHVITTATGYPEEVAEKYKNAFAELDVVCDVTHVTNSDQADAPAFLKEIEQADVIFFSGGDQSKLAAVFNDTKFLKLISEHNKSGKVIAGTSAGAAIMSKLMIAGGHPDNAHIKGAIKSERGFSLAENIIFDTHFLNRDRLPRLFNLVAGDTAKIGIGLDENTGVVLKEDQTIEVIGGQNVTIVDGSDLKNCDIKDVKDGEMFQADGFKVTTLKPGQKYSIPKPPRS